MKTLIVRITLALVAATAWTGVIVAGSPLKHASGRKEQVEERTVFVTGSLIPQRVKLRRIGTTTASPVRIIDRGEIDGTGRQTTPGALVNDPSLRIVGH